MRMLIKAGSSIIFWGMTVLLSSGLIDDANGQEWGSIREKVKGSIVFIEATKQKRDGTNRDVSTSTGFIVSKQGHLITVAHAVPKPDEDEIVSYRASVKTKHEQKYEIQLIVLT